MNGSPFKELPSVPCHVWEVSAGKSGLLIMAKKLGPKRSGKTAKGTHNSFSGAIEVSQIACQMLGQTETDRHYLL